MSRYTGPQCRFCRREGEKLYLKGERCYTDKCSFDRKPYAPGLHGKRRTKMSDYAAQLREKQKVRRVYGMLERPFVTLFKQAAAKRSSAGVTSDVFFRRLELRLYNVVFRMGFAQSRNEARQLVSHGHFLVDGKPCNIPSRQLTAGAVVTLKEASRKLPCVENGRNLYHKRSPLAWIEVDDTEFSGKVIALPKKEDIAFAVKDHLIVELYNK